MLAANCPWHTVSVGGASSFGCSHNLPLVCSHTVICMTGMSPNIQPHGSTMNSGILLSTFGNSTFVLMSTHSKYNEQIFALFYGKSPEARFILWLFLTLFCAACINTLEILIDKNCIFLYKCFLAILLLILFYSVADLFWMYSLFESISNENQFELLVTS